MTTGPYTALTPEELVATARGNLDALLENTRELGEGAWFMLTPTEWSPDGFDTWVTLDGPTERDPAKVMLFAGRRADPDSDLDQPGFRVRPASAANDLTDIVAEIDRYAALHQS
jgi:hypothetical protein